MAGDRPAQTSMKAQRLDILGRAVFYQIFRRAFLLAGAGIVVIAAQHLTRVERDHRSETLYRRTLKVLTLRAVVAE